MPASISVTDFDIFRTNQEEYLTCFVRDPKTEELNDVYGTSTFSVIDISDDSTVFSENFTSTGSANIVRSGAGVYQYLFDTTAYPDEYLASFRCVLEGQVLTNNIFVKTVSAKQFKYVAALRNQVDKARKSISDEIENMDRPTNEPGITFFYGYTDSHMIFYLERGTQIINIVPPYTNFTVDTFPFTQAGSILIDAAVIAALESQGIFAIDTDYNYSLGNNSLVIDHFTKLNTYISGLVARFDKNLVRFKQQFRTKGTVMFQWMPGGVRSARQLNAMPGGFWSRLLSSAFV